MSADSSDAVLTDGLAGRLLENYWVFHVSYSVPDDTSTFGGTFIYYGDTYVQALEQLYRNVTFLGYLTDVTSAHLGQYAARHLYGDIYSLMLSKTDNIASQILAKHGNDRNFLDTIDAIVEIHRNMPLIRVNRLTELLPPA
jgi:hypothetical protein